MEVKIYADILFAVSFAALFASYGMTALLCGIRVKTVRILLGSFAVALISTVLVLCVSGGVNPAVIIALAMLGTYLCLGVRSIKRNISCSLLSLLCAALIGGAKAALSRTGLLDNTAAGVVLTAALVYAAALLVKKRLAAGVIKKQRLCRLTVCRDGRKAELCALADTGNELKGKNLESVIIAERQAVSCLFELKNADTSIRLLPYKSIGGSGVLIGIVCDYAVIDGVKKENVIVAPIDKCFGGSYNALINPETEVI